MVLVLVVLGRTLEAANLPTLEDSSLTDRENPLEDTEQLRDNNDLQEEDDWLLELRALREDDNEEMTVEESRAELSAASVEAAGEDEVEEQDGPREDLEEEEEDRMGDHQEDGGSRSLLVSDDLGKAMQPRSEAKQRGLAGWNEEALLAEAGSYLDYWDSPEEMEDEEEEEERVLGK